MLPKHSTIMLNEFYSYRNFHYNKNSNIFRVSTRSHTHTQTHVKTINQLKNFSHTLHYGRLYKSIKKNIVAFALFFKNSLFHYYLYWTQSALIKMTRRRGIGGNKKSYDVVQKNRGAIFWCTCTIQYVGTLHTIHWWYTFVAYIWWK